MLRWLRVMVSLASILAAPTAHACVKASVLADAEGERLATLQQVDEACRQGLSLLREGRPGEALSHLETAWAEREVMEPPLDLPLAEAMFGAGAPTGATLAAWERVGQPADLVQARRIELVHRLVVGRAAALLRADPSRPAADLLKQRAALDREEPAAPESAVQPNRVGVLLPLTGRLARLGRAILDGIRLGLDDDTTLVVRDTGGGSTSAARLVRELAADGVIGIVGPLDRSVAAVAAEIAEAQGVPLLHLSVDDGAHPERRWAVRAFVSRASQYRALLRRARLEGVKRFAVLHADSAWGRALADAFVREVEAAGLKVSVRVDYPESAASLTRTARKVAHHRFGAVFVADHGARAGLVLRYLAGEDVWSRGSRRRLTTTGDVRYVQVFGPSEWLEAPVQGEDARYLAGVMLATEWPGPQDPAVAGFASRAESTLGRAPSLFEAVGYDAIRLVQAAGGSSRAALAKALHRERGFDGVLGRVRFDAAGEPTRDVRLFRVDKGRFQAVRTR